MKPLLLLVLCLASAASLCAKPAPPKLGEREPATLIGGASDIVVLSGREETVVGYFRRNKLMVAGMLTKELNEMLEGKMAGRKQFVNYCSYNTDPTNTFFGANVIIEAPSEATVRLVREAIGKQAKRPLALVFRIDDRNADHCHLVGYVYRSSAGFFRNEKRFLPDDFSPADLAFRSDQAK